MLPADAQRGATGHHDRQSATARKQAGDIDRRFDDLLEVVEDQQQVALAEVVADGIQCAAPVCLREAERSGDGRQDQRRLAYRGQIDEARAELIAALDGGRGVDRQTRLARATWSSEREQSDIGLNQTVADVDEQRVAADQWSGLSKRSRLH